MQSEVSEMAGVAQSRVRVGHRALEVKLVKVLYRPRPRQLHRHVHLHSESSPGADQKAHSKVRIQGFGFRASDLGLRG